MVESAGVLVYKKSKDGYLYLLAHPGGPYFEGRDSDVWTIPKGEIEPNETDLLGVAMREFQEETGVDLWKIILERKLEVKNIGTVTQKSGKVVHAWAVEADLDTDSMKSNHFSMEWPKGSGKIESFPEIDRWFYLNFGLAMVKINPAQAAFLKRV